MSGERQRVFCASLGDVFDEEVPNFWRTDLFDLIGRTPKLDWLILTKRPENFKQFLPESWLRLGLPANIWLGVSVENQSVAEERIPLLVEIPAVVRFLSLEPLLKSVNVTAWLPPSALTGGRTLSDPWLDWLIVGGESDLSDPRPMHPSWARSLRDQATGRGVSFFMKQWGSCIPVEILAGASGRPYMCTPPPRERAQKAYLWENLNDFRAISPSDVDPYYLIPGTTLSLKMAKADTGHLLDGVSHRQWPKPITIVQP